MGEGPGPQKAIEAWRKHPAPLRLRCGVMHYAWGDRCFIPALLGRPHPAPEPWAEFWMGAHPRNPSRALLDGLEVPLPDLLTQAPAETLGAACAARFHGALPYLFKVLAAAAPLSIQCHPDREQAALGFAAEEARGVPIDAPDRSYRDRNHKPELLVALKPFHVLRGFRPLPEIGRLLGGIPEIAPLAADFRPTPEGLKAFYGRFMRLEPSQVDAVLTPLVRRLERRAAERPYGSDEPEHWILRADRCFSREGRRDRGLLSIYLLNLIRLEPGQAIHLPPGVLHAYLEGAGLEIMANSDNVLRGGLTSKHVDVEELLDKVRFEGGEPEILEPRSIGPHEERWEAPAEEFALSRVRVEEGADLVLDAGHGPEIILPVEEVPGTRVCLLDDGGGVVGLERGEAAFLPAAAGALLRARDGSATLYRAAVPPVQALREASR